MKLEKWSLKADYKSIIIINHFNTDSLEAETRVFRNIYPMTKFNLIEFEILDHMNRDNIFEAKEFM